MCRQFSLPGFSSTDVKVGSNPSIFSARGAQLGFQGDGVSPPCSLSLFWLVAQVWSPRMEAEAEWEHYFSSLTLELWLLLLLFVSDWLSWCVSYYYFLPASCSDHFLDVLSLSIRGQGSVEKWKMVSPLVISSVRLKALSFSSSPQVQQRMFPTIAHNSTHH